MWLSLSESSRLTLSDSWATAWAGRWRCWQRIGFPIASPASAQLSIEMSPTSFGGLHARTPSSRAPGT